MNTQAITDFIIQNKKPLLLGTALVVVVIFFLGSSILSLVHNKLELHKLAKQSILLDKEHAELTATMELLEKEDAAYLEKIARTQYNMVGPNEVEFRFQPDK